MNPLFSRCRVGFTLIEVMVATAIMAFVVLVVVTIASDTLRVYDRAVADLSTQSEARGVLDALDNDFSTAMLRADGHCWMEVVVPGSSPSGMSGVPDKVGNLQGVNHPIVMLFASPLDRPRWPPGAPTYYKNQWNENVRASLRGDVCAIAYRIGQRSPFDAPGDPIQQIYGVFRTIIDSENTFVDALPMIAASPLPSSGGTIVSPWNYWSGSRQFVNYSKSPSPGQDTRPLIDSSAVVPKLPNLPCWTFDDNNFIGSNVVSMNLIFWCTSSLPATGSASVIADPAARSPWILRPVICASSSDGKSSLALSSGGWLGLWNTTQSSNQVIQGYIRYAPTTLPATIKTTYTKTEAHPFDFFSTRLRVFSDRMYPDNLDPATAPDPTKGFPYMPYSLKAVEVSITVLTPDGSKELRGLQMMKNSPKVLDADFKRIVYMYGRNYTRYIRVLSNGG